MQVFPTPVGMNRCSVSVVILFLSVPHTRGDEPADRNDCDDLEERKTPKQIKTTHTKTAKKNTFWNTFDECDESGIISNVGVK